MQRSRGKSEDQHFCPRHLEGVHVLDGRRFEVVADGLTLWHGAQLAIHTKLVSPLHRDGTGAAADRNGAGQH